jgi:putative methionine-R-sulfoxide reductase with GAF domain
MKNLKNTGLLFTAIYVVGCLVSGFLLIKLKSSLALDAGVLSAEELPLAQPYLISVQLAVFVTFIIGIVGYYFIQRGDNKEIIYVDRKSGSGTSADQHISQEKNGHQKLELPKVFQGNKAQSTESLFKAICNEIEAVSGAYYNVKGTGKSKKLELAIPYALSFGETNRPVFEIGEGLIGQSAKEMNALFIDDIPETAVQATSGLGQAKHSYLAVLPVTHKNKVLGVCEIGTFKPIDKQRREWLINVSKTFGEKIAPKRSTDKSKES